MAEGKADKWQRFIDGISKPERDNAQLSLLEVDAAHDYWWGMPSFTFKDVKPIKTITINLLTDADAAEFGRVIGARITANTDSLWFPPRDRMAPNAFYFDGEATPTRYPICIPSKGRFDCQTTGKLLDSFGYDYRFFVEQHEHDAYAQAIGADKVVALPFSNLGQGSIPARNFIWDWAIANGHQRHWVLDDNIDAFYRLTANRRVRVRGGSILNAVEDFADRYENIAIAGLQHDGFVNDAHTRRPIIWNSRVYSCSLIDSSLPERWRGRYNEDTDLCLRLLKRGMVTANFAALLMSKGTTVGAKGARPMKGGNTDNVYNTNDYRKAFAESLREQHPDCVKVTWKFGRWHHEVDYSGFRKNRPVLRPGVVPAPNDCEYGMGPVIASDKGAE